MNANPLRRTSLTAIIAPRPTDPQWELAAESIAVKIRWFGLVVGFLLANLGSTTTQQTWLNSILAVGFCFTAIDSYYFLRRRVFLKDYPLLIAAMESLFIALLCQFESGTESPFRFYYLLSLICCALRYTPWTTYVACALDCLSYTSLFAQDSHSPRESQLFLLMIVMLVWVTWASASLAGLIRRGGEDLQELNRRLRENQALLESRIVERTQALQESQAQVLHQEKMAAFGLLAAGIAHEVGNPLTSISAVVQMLERQDNNQYTREKLGIVAGQLLRIQVILRELVTFSRPASTSLSQVAIRDVVDEAFSIAKYYKGGKNRVLVIDIPELLPTVQAVRDQLVQILFNFIVNAIDATGKGGRIEVTARVQDAHMQIVVRDDGMGIAPEARDQLFQPFYTTKKHGTGLGLFVIRKIAESHGATVRVLPTEGSGTAFELAWPLRQEQTL
ncbi:MAG: sensor histidine kinase [Gemmataceae bacterium]